MKENGLTVSDRLEQLGRSRYKPEEIQRIQEKLSSLTPKAIAVRDLAQRSRIRELNERVAKLKQAATTDPSTGLLNRRGFSSESERILALTRRTGLPISLGHFDLNGLGAINNNFGHSEGDRAIDEVAQALIKNTRRADLVARFGGDEFVVLMPGTAQQGANEVVNKVRADVSERSNRTNVDGQLVIPYPIEVAGGAVEIRNDESLVNALERADVVMYADKQRIKDRGIKP